MKVLVLSDSHRRGFLVRQAVEAEGDPDLLIHCGDAEEDLEAVLPGHAYPVRGVSGNCDWRGDLPGELLLREGGHTVYVAHGHVHGVRCGLDRLALSARKKGADLALFGHTHEPGIWRMPGLLLVNPGSIAEPRQAGRQKTYAILTLEEGEEPRAELRVLEGK